MAAAGMPDATGCVQEGGPNRPEVVRLPGNVPLPCPRHVLPGEAPCLMALLHPKLIRQSGSPCRTALRSRPRRRCSGRWSGDSHPRRSRCRSHAVPEESRSQETLVATTTARQRTFSPFSVDSISIPPGFPARRTMSCPSRIRTPVVSDRVEDVSPRVHPISDNPVGRSGWNQTTLFPSSGVRCSRRWPGSGPYTAPSRTRDRSAIRRVSSRESTEGIAGCSFRNAGGISGFTSGGDEKDVVRLLCAVGKDHAVPGRVDPSPPLYRAGRGFPGRPGPSTGVRDP